jgi:hydroxymethylbilane synthase
MKIRIGTRKSKLAIIQAIMVMNKILRINPEFECEIVGIVTSGDKIQNKCLHDSGGKALFLKELEQALIEGMIDIAVHSLKDVPGVLSNEFIISAMLEREDPRDVLISKNSASITELKHGAVVGTSSIRRRVLLQKLRPDLKFIIYRGNIDSRIAKFYESGIDATILAASGLNRIGFNFNSIDKLICSYIPTDVILPAVCQGVVAVETLSTNYEMQKLCGKINDQLTFDVMQAERAFVEYLDADCKTPLSAFARIIDEDRIQLDCMLSDIDGKNVIFGSGTSSISVARKLGISLAKDLSDKISTNHTL